MDEPSKGVILSVTILEGAEVRIVIYGAVTCVFEMYASMAHA